MQHRLRGVRHVGGDVVPAPWELRLVEQVLRLLHGAEDKGPIRSARSRTYRFRRSNEKQGAGMIRIVLVNCGLCRHRGRSCGRGPGGEAEAVSGRHPAADGLPARGNRDQGADLLRRLRRQRGDLPRQPEDGRRRRADPRRRRAAGDRHRARGHRLFVAGAGSGKAYVYDAAPSRSSRRYNFGASPTFINDVVVTHNAAYFTDSQQAAIYRVPIGPRGALGDAQTISARRDYVHVGGGRSTSTASTRRRTARP